MGYLVNVCKGGGREMAGIEFREDVEERAGR